MTCLYVIIPFENNPFSFESERETEIGERDFANKKYLTTKNLFIFTCAMKILPLHSESLKALQQIAAAAKNKEKIVFVSGLFNVLHPGHLRMLRFASECGDYLVVGVQKSPEGETHVLGEEFRLEIMPLSSEILRKSLLLLVNRTSLSRGVSTKRW
ncbi:MAG: hypothetical protein CSB28_02395 [Desulfobacterales bacterium]|nr:MAG: hypothetical protein CSB28_02395 [Desulfobacterales bacterium]